jgi:hypothetical protein
MLLLAMLWPVVKIANRVEPFILGLPFLLFWFVLISALQFFGLLSMFLLERRRDRHG